jgi:metal-responsive CopG/Arc/MetJ family transcriptional regulator
MTTKMVRLTASVPQNIVEETDKIALQLKSSRSKLVAESLKEMIEKRKKQQMAEGYQVLAERHQEFAAGAAKAIKEVIPEW